MPAARFVGISRRIGRTTLQRGRWYPRESSGLFGDLAPGLKTPTCASATILRGLQPVSDLTTSAKPHAGGTSSAQEELDRHFATIDRHLPAGVSRFLRWLRKPSSFIVRIIVSVLLILGGILSFLPILGLWMLPLGLIIIAQDLPFLQPPLVKVLTWIENRWFKKS